MTGVQTCALPISEQIILIKANITRLEELRDITQAFYDNGMAMEVDVKRVNINLENLKVQRAKRQQKSRHKTDQPCLRFFWKVMLVGYVTAESQNVQPRRV